MCGIIGRVGKDNSVPFVVKGLERLEYRGYDSAGIAVLSEKGVNISRSVGKISCLKEKIANEQINGNVCIGHTRWATHGKVSIENAHPHTSYDRKFTIVHNGIIENATDLFALNFDNKDILKSTTDSEIIAHLLSKYYNGNPIQTLSRVAVMLEGSYALGVLCDDFPNVVFCMAKESPLVVGCGEMGTFLASDSLALEDFCEKYVVLKNQEIAQISQNEIIVFDKSEKKIEKNFRLIEKSEGSYEKGNFEHFMLREIYEQAQAVENTLNSVIKEGKIVFENQFLSKEYIKNSLKKIIFVGCGSAYNVGLVGKNVVEELCRINGSAEIASEFRYSNSSFGSETLAVFISQSGETADTLAALKFAKSKGAKTISIVNVSSSAIAKESDFAICTKAGREVSVATTKAYSAQLAMVFALAVFISKTKEKISSGKELDLINELLQLPRKIDETLKMCEEKAIKIAEKFSENDDIYFIGRQNSFAVATEGSLKMKEISYIHSEAYAAGELKHGTISLIDKGTPVVAVVCDDKVFNKTLSNISEVKARGAYTLVVTDKENLINTENFDDVIKVAKTENIFEPSLLILPLQLIAYQTARKLGCDIDKPKNLAKSVTVE